MPVLSIFPHSWTSLHSWLSSTCRGIKSLWESGIKGIVWIFSRTFWSPVVKWIGVSVSVSSHFSHMYKCLSWKKLHVLFSFLCLIPDDMLERVYCRDWEQLGVVIKTGKVPGCSPTYAHCFRQQVMSQGFGSLLSTWEREMEFLAYGLDLCPPLPLWAFGEQPAEGSFLSPKQTEKSCFSFMISYT